MDNSDPFFAKLIALINTGHEEEADADPAETIAEQGTPSASIAILDDGKISAHCFSTVGDTTESLFQACSISKPTAGLATFKLIEAGKLGLEDRIVDRLPRDVLQVLAAPKTVKLLRLITIKHLLSHTSGLSIDGFYGYPPGAKIPTVKEILAGEAPSNSLSVEIKALPGFEFAYSGGGWTVLQLIVEHVTGKPLADVVAETVFKPLGMTNSFYKVDPGSQKLARAHHTGYTAAENSYHAFPEQAAAGVWTTPSDLLKMVLALQDSAQAADGQSAFLRRDLARQMLTHIAGGMGLSLFTDRIAFGHSGSNDPGYRTFVFGYSDATWNDGEDECHTISTSAAIPSRAGIAVMTNSVVGTDAIWKLLHAISYLKGWPQVPGYHGHDDAQVPWPAVAAEDAVVDEAWKEWLGEWEDGLKIGEDADGRPVAGNDDEAMLPLVPAAVPSWSYDEMGESIDLLLDGTEMMLRLGWDDDEPVLEMWNGCNGTASILYREGHWDEINEADAKDDDDEEEEDEDD